MAIRDAFNDNAKEMYRMDNVLDSVDLTVTGWNRATVADGQWLQDHAIGPLSARDVYLADCIDNVSTSVDGIRQTLNDMGIGSGESGANTLGFNVKPLNNRLENKSQWLDGTMQWSEKPISLVPSGIGDDMVPPASLTYMTFGQGASKAGNITLGDNEIAGLLQANIIDGQAYQLAFTKAGLYYRSLTGSHGTTSFEAGDAQVVNEPGNFSALPFGAMTKTEADNYYAPKDKFNIITGQSANWNSTYSTVASYSANGKWLIASDLNNYVEKDKSYANLSAGSATNAGYATNAGAAAKADVLTGTSGDLGLADILAAIPSVTADTIGTDTVITAVNTYNLAAQYLYDGTNWHGGSDFTLTSMFSTTFAVQAVSNGNTYVVTGISGEINNTQTAKSLAELYSDLANSKVTIAAEAGSTITAGTYDVTALLQNIVNIININHPPVVNQGQG